MTARASFSTKWLRRMPVLRALVRFFGLPKAASLSFTSTIVAYDYTSNKALSQELIAFYIFLCYYILMTSSKRHLELAPPLTEELHDSNFLRRNWRPIVSGAALLLTSTVLIGLSRNSGDLGLEAPKVPAVACEFSEDHRIFTFKSGDGLDSAVLAIAGVDRNTCFTEAEAEIRQLNPDDTFPPNREQSVLIPVRLQE